MYPKLQAARHPTIKVPARSKKWSVNHRLTYITPPKPVFKTSVFDRRKHGFSSLTNLFRSAQPAVMANPSEKPTQLEKAQNQDTVQDQAHHPVQDESNAATEAFNNVKVSLADLCAKGTSFYAKKNYVEAADLYARAAELQSELNGEMSPENAEILFLYGRSLYKVGQGKSDVLGGRAGGEKKKSNGASKSKKNTPQTDSALETVAEEGAAIIAAKDNTEQRKEEGVETKKPLFTFTGDENFEDSDEDEDDVGVDRNQSLSIACYTVPCRGDRRP